MTPLEMNLILFITKYHKGEFFIPRWISDEAKTLETFYVRLLDAMSEDHHQARFDHDLF